MNSLCSCILIGHSGNEHNKTPEGAKLTLVEVDDLG